MTVLADLITGWFLFGGLLVILGSVSTRWVVLPRVRETGAAVATDRQHLVARVMRWGFALVLLGLLMVLARQFMEFRDPYSPALEDLGLLLATPWARTWRLGMGLAVVGLVASVMAYRRRDSGWVLASFAALALGFFPGLTGHAAGAEAGRWLALGADALHVWAAGAWIGGLGLVLALDRWGAGGPDGSASADTPLAELVPAFSPVAMASVGTLVVTGLLASTRHLGSVSSLWSTSYGLLLLAKVSIVMGVLGLGALNWRRLTPQLGTVGGNRGMRRAARLEFLLANLVLLITAVLVRTSPGLQ